MPNLPEDWDQAARLRELERRVDNLEGSNQLQQAAVGAGGVRVHSGGSVIVEDPGQFIFRQSGEDLVVTPQESKVFHDEGLGNIPSGGEETYSTNFTFPEWAATLNFALLGDWKVDDDSGGNNAHNSRFKVEYTHPSLGSSTEQSFVATHSDSSTVAYASRNWGRIITPTGGTLVTVTLTLQDALLFAAGGADTRATLVALFIPTA